MHAGRLLALLFVVPRLTFAAEPVASAETEQKPMAEAQPQPAPGPPAPPADTKGPEAPLAAEEAKRASPPLPVHVPPVQKKPEDAGSMAASTSLKPADLPAPAEAEKPAAPKKVSAQAGEKKPEAASTATKVDADKPESEKRSPPEGKPAKDSESLLEIARQYYEAILAKDAERVSGACRAPFFFEGKAVSIDADIRKLWESSLQSEPLKGVRLLGVELYTPEEMVAKYGKAPERLSAWPLKGNMISVGNLGGHAAVVLWRKSGVQWHAAGFHD